MNTLHIIIKGNVQGVGFRATAEHYANKLEINGSVKNLANGSVEIYAQGEQEALDPFVEGLKEDRGLAKIEHVAVEECQVQKKYNQFQIIF